jgi:hypothetical protein
MPQINDDTINHVFTYHAPKGDQANRYTAIREAGRRLSLEILAMTPESPERTLALRDVQRAVMMANAAIALNE